MTHNEVLVTEFPTGWKVEVEVKDESEARYLASLLKDRVNWRATYESHMETHDIPEDADLLKDEEAAIAESMVRESEFFAEREDRA